MGDQLPSETELVQLFKVSRPSIREAVRTLCIFGFLEIRKGDGTYVKNPHLDHYYNGIQQSLELLIELKPKTFFEILEIQEVLETLSASEAVKNVKKEDLSLLTVAFNKLERSLNNSKAYAEYDMAFHNTIALCSHNTILYYFVSLLGSILRPSYLEFSKTESIAPSIHHGHKEIFRAISNRSKQDAVNAMKTHVENSRKVTRKFLKQKLT